MKEHGYEIEKYKGELENIRLTSDYYNKIKLMEFSSFFFAWIGMGACIVHYEFEYFMRLSDIDPDFMYESSNNSRRLMVLLYINLICTVLVSIS